MSFNVMRHLPQISAMCVFLPQPGGNTRLLHKLILVPLHGLDALRPGAFPFVHGILLVPCLHKLLLLTAHVIARVGILHIEVCAGDLAPRSGRGLGLIAVDLHVAAAEGSRFTGKHLVIEIRAHGVYRADGRVQVVHIGLHQAVFWVDLLGALAATKLFAPVVHTLWRTVAPFWERLAEVFSGQGVLPLDAAGALLVLGRGEALGQRHVALGVVGRTAVESYAVVGIDLAEHLFGAGKTIVGRVACGQGQSREQERGQEEGKQKFAH